jgi:hypothetical protein
VAYSPTNNAIVLSAEYGVSDVGTYLISNSGQPIRLAAPADQVMWSDQTGSFLILVQGQLLAYRPDGTLTNLPFQVSAIPEISPDGGAWAWVDGNGTYAGDVSSGKIAVVLSAESQVTWQPGSSNLILCSGTQVFIANAPDYSASPIYNPVSDCRDAQLVP